MTVSRDVLREVHIRCVIFEADYLYNFGTSWPLFHWPCGGKGRI